MRIFGTCSLRRYGGGRSGRRLLAGAGAAALVLLATACGQAATGVSDPASTVSAEQSSPASGADTATPASSPASSAAASVTPGATASATQAGCAAQAARTYYHVLSARRSATGGFLLTGHIAVMICGGPDDWHFEDASATVPATVLPGAQVEMVDMSDGASATPIPAGTLITALARDQSTGTFLVTGPLTAITGLTEIFHP